MSGVVCYAAAILRKVILIDFLLALVAALISWRTATALGSAYFLGGLILIILGGFAYMNRNPFQSTPYLRRPLSDFYEPNESPNNRDRYSLLSMPSTQQWVIALLLAGILAVFISSFINA